MVKKRGSSWKLGGKGRPPNSAYDDGTYVKLKNKSVPADPLAPRRPRGWPKGKPRGPRKTWNHYK